MGTSKPNCTAADLRVGDTIRTAIDKAEILEIRHTFGGVELLVKGKQKRILWFFSKQGATKAKSPRRKVAA